MLTTEFSLGPVCSEPVLGEYTTNTPVHNIFIFTHGNCTNRSSQGVFPTIAQDLTQYGTSLFYDLTYTENGSGNIIVPPFSTQADIQTEVFNFAKDRFPNSQIWNISHSQGCFTTELANLPYDETILISFPLVHDLYNGFTQRFFHGENSYLNPEGWSQIMTPDRRIFRFPKEFFNELKEYEPWERFIDMAKRCRPMFVRPTEDKLLVGTDFEAFEKAIGYGCETLEGNHNFSREHTKSLAEFLFKKISQKELILS